MTVPAQTVPWLFQEEMWDPEAVLGSFITAITARADSCADPKHKELTWKCFIHGQIKHQIPSYSKAKCLTFLPKSTVFFKPDFNSLL